MLQPDAGDYLLWHYGNGKMVSYSLLWKCITLFVAGAPLNAQFISRADFFTTHNNEKSQLSYKVLSKSFIGNVIFPYFFLHNVFILWQVSVEILSFGKKTSPVIFVVRRQNILVKTKRKQIFIYFTNIQYISVADGQCCGPTTRKVSQLQELDRAEDDDDPLCAGSIFKDRVLLKSKEERMKVKKLVTGEIELFEYLAGDITSESGQLVWDLATRLEREFEELPREYAVFLGDVAKFTSVSGYLQCTGPEALEVLKVK